MEEIEKVSVEEIVNDALMELKVRADEIYLEEKEKRKCWDELEYLEEKANDETLEIIHKIRDCYDAQQASLYK